MPIRPGAYERIRPHNFGVPKTVYKTTHSKSVIDAYKATNPEEIFWSDKFVLIFSAKV